MKLERHGAFHRAAQAVAGLADAEQLLAGGDGGLDRPAVRVAGHDAFDAVAAVGGEQCQDLVAAGVADQHDAAGLGAERAVPEGGGLGDRRRCRGGRSATP